MRNIMFLGQKPIGELCFDELLNGQNNNYCIGAAVSNSDKDTVWWHGNRIYEQCIVGDIPFVDNAQKNENLIKEVIDHKKINFIVSIGHSWILSDEILRLVNYQAVNLHLAKLPDYKGNYTYNHAILNDEKMYGVTFHWMTPKVDTGDYIFVNEFPIRDDDTAYSLYKKSVAGGLLLFQKFIYYIGNNLVLPRKKMKGIGNFYSRKSLDGLREIQSMGDLEDVAQKSRAFYFPPFENAYFSSHGRKYYVIPESKQE